MGFVGGDLATAEEMRAIDAGRLLDSEYELVKPFVSRMSQMINNLRNSSVNVFVERIISVDPIGSISDERGCNIFNLRGSGITTDDHVCTQSCRWLRFSLVHSLFYGYHIELSCRYNEDRVQDYFGGMFEWYYSELNQRLAMQCRKRNKWSGYIDELTAEDLMI